MQRRTTMAAAILVASISYVCCACAQEADTSADSWSKDDKFAWTVGGSVAFVTAWGIAKWDYGGRSPQAQSEGWLGESTKEGGADKLGHLQFSYAIANGVPMLYESWGFDRTAAAKRGLWTSLIIMNYMEIGDSFSDYGFAYQDLAMNVIGAYAGYWLRNHEYWDERVTLRVEYTPEALNVDFFTEYQRTKYLVALRTDTIVKHRVARWFDLQLGYFARGYSDGIDPHRDWFIGVGVNLSTAARHFGLTKTSHLLRYWQPEGISLQHNTELE